MTSTDDYTPLQLKKIRRIQILLLGFGAVIFCWLMTLVLPTIFVIAALLAYVLLARILFPVVGKLLVSATASTFLKRGD